MASLYAPQCSSANAGYPCITRRVVALPFAALLAVHQVEINRRAVTHCKPHGDLRLLAEPETHLSIRAGTNVEGFIRYGLLGMHNVLESPAGFFSAGRRK